MPARTIKNALILVLFGLILAVILGLVLRREQVPDQLPAAVIAPQHPVGTLSPESEVTKEQLKSIADKQAQPLLAQLQSTPDDPALLTRLGYIYYATRNYREAATYYKRSIDRRDDVVVRNELGRAYYYAGNLDSALAEFGKVLKSNPDNVNALFNVGMIKWQGKSDANGALAAWRQILKKHPNHARKAEIEQLIARAQQQLIITKQIITDNPLP